MYSNYERPKPNFNSYSNKNYDTVIKSNIGYYKYRDSPSCSTYTDVSEPYCTSCQAPNVIKYDKYQPNNCTGSNSAVKRNKCWFGVV